MSSWTVVLAAVVAEVAALTVLTAPPPRHPRLAQLLAVAAWAGSLALLPVAVRDLSLDVVYAVWSAGGAAGLAVTASVLLGRRMDRLSVCGLALTLTGTALVLSARATPS